MLICLCGKGHPLFQRARDYLEAPDAMSSEEKETYLKSYEIIQEKTIRRLKSSRHQDQGGQTDRGLALLL